MKPLLKVPVQMDIFWKCWISRLQMKESTSVWLRMRLEQQRGPSLSKFRVWNMRNYHTLKKMSLLNYTQTPPGSGYCALLHYSLKLLLSSPVNGGYSNWEEWGLCSSTCGQGFQERIRVCDNPKPANGGRSCSGPSIDSRKCHVGLCPGKTQQWLSACLPVCITC